MGTLRSREHQRGARGSGSRVSRRAWNGGLTAALVSARLAARLRRCGGVHVRLRGLVLRRLRAVLDELEPEAALDAEVPAGDVVIERRGHLYDLVVLHVELEVAADTAVRADRLRDGLVGLVPGALLAHLVLA